VERDFFCAGRSAPKPLKIKAAACIILCTSTVHVVSLIMNTTNHTSDHLEIERMLAEGCPNDYPQHSPEFSPSPIPFSQAIQNQDRRQYQQALEAAYGRKAAA
jgi:hypothetical protein